MKGFNIIIDRELLVVFRSSLASDTEVLADVVVRIEKEAGPVIFSQSHPTAIGSLIFPSESLNDDPSNEIQSAGKWLPGQALLLRLVFCYFPITLHRSFFLQEKKANPYIRSFFILVNAMVKIFNSLHPASTFVVKFLKKLSIPYYFISQRKRDIGSGV